MRNAAFVELKGSYSRARIAHDAEHQKRRMSFIVNRSLVLFVNRNYTNEKIE